METKFGTEIEEDLQSRFKAEAFRRKLTMKKATTEALEMWLAPDASPHPDAALAMKVLDFLRSGSDDGWKPIGTTIIDLAKKGK